MRILLISLYDLNYALGLKSLYAVLKAEGHEVKFVHFGTLEFVQLKPTTFLDFELPLVVSETPQEDIDELKRLVTDWEPGLIGFSLMSAHYPISVRLTEELRGVTDVPIAWGGIHPTIEPERCLRHADIVCRGEGEEAILDLVRAIEQGRSTAEIPNLWSKGDGQVRRNPPRPLIQDLDQVPFRAVSDEDNIYIPASAPKVLDKLDPDRRVMYTNYYIMCSRGCPFSCTYCCNHFLREDLYRDSRPYVRTRSVAHVIEELTYAKESLHAPFISFYDDVFIADKKWVAEFCKEYKAKIGIPFYCYFHTQYVEEEIVDQLVEAGLQIASLGIQSGSERVRREVFGRRQSNEEILEVARMCNTKLKMNYDILLDNPFESDDDTRETLKLFLQFPLPFNIVAHSLVYFPNYALTKRAVAEGLIGEQEVADNLTKNYFVAQKVKRGPLRRALYSLIFATQRPEVDRHVIRKWGTDPDMLAEPERLHATLYEMITLEERRSLKRQLEEAYQRTTQLGEQLAEHDRWLQAAWAERAELHRALHAKRSELGEVHQQFAEAWDKLDEAKGEVGARVREIESLREQLQHARDELNEIAHSKAWRLAGASQRLWSLLARLNPFRKR